MQRSGSASIVHRRSNRGCHGVQEPEVANEAQAVGQLDIRLQPQQQLPAHSGGEGPNLANLARSHSEEKQRCCSSRQRTMPMITA